MVSYLELEVVADIKDGWQLLAFQESRNFCFLLSLDLISYVLIKFMGNSSFSDIYDLTSAPSFLICKGIFFGPMGKC